MAYEIFNVTSATNNTDFYGFITTVNSYVDNSLGLIILMMIFAVLFISLLRREVTPGKAFGAASWVVMISAIALKMMGLIDGYFFIGSLLLPGIAILMIFFGSNN